MRRYVGLDAHSKRSSFMVQDEQGNVLAKGSVPTTPEGMLQLRTRHDLPPGTRVALESGTMAFYVARQLRQLGLDPVVVDAHEVRAKALRPNQKSDSRDAWELCEGIRRDVYRSIVHVPPEAIERLRETLGRRRHVVRLKTMQVNAAKRLLRTAGLQELCSSLQYDSGWQKLLEHTSSDASLNAFLQTHYTLWLCAHEQVAQIERSLHEQKIAFQQDCDRLQTVPGVGPIVALTVIAAFSDVKRFPSAKHAASYAGLVASTYDSGERVQHGRITRRGSSELRAMLCEAAHHAWRSNSPFYPYFSSLCVRRGYKMAVVAVAHRLCRILFAMMRDQSEFNLKQLAVEEGRFEKKVVRRFRRKVEPAPV